LCARKLLQALLIRRRYVPVKWQWSAEFNDYVDKVDNKRVLLDHIMLSNDLVEHAVCAGIAHDVYRAAATTSGNPLSRQNRVSDHVPVYCDLK
jgi:exonuclease III